HVVTLVQHDVAEVVEPRSVERISEDFRRHDEHPAVRVHLHVARQDADRLGAEGPGEVVELLVRERLERRGVGDALARRERRVDGELGDERLARPGRRGHDDGLPRFDRADRFELEVVERERVPGAKRLEQLHHSTQYHGGRGGPRKILPIGSERNILAPGRDHGDQATHEHSPGRGVAQEGAEDPEGLHEHGGDHAGAAGGPGQPGDRGDAEKLDPQGPRALRRRLPVAGAVILLDTNVYLFALKSETGANFFERHFLPRVFQTHLSSVVVEELYAGALDGGAMRLVERQVGALERAGRLVTPTFDDWKEAGTVVAAITRKEAGRRSKTQRMLNDILLALSARRIGAELFTFNREDFLTIRRHTPFPPNDCSLAVRTGAMLKVRSPTAIERHRRDGYYCLLPVLSA